MNYICIYNKYIFTMHTQWNECECLYFMNVCVLDCNKIHPHVTKGNWEVLWV
jgi:hypothetical protein